MINSIAIVVLGLWVSILFPGSAAVDFDFSAGLPETWSAAGSVFGTIDEAEKLQSDLSLFYAMPVSVPGIIVSPEFEVCERYLNIRVDGETLKGQLAVIRVLDGGKQVIRKSLAYNLQDSGWLKDGWFTFDVGDYLGETVYFQLSECYSLAEVNLVRIFSGTAPLGDFSGAAYIEATRRLLDADAATADSDPFRPVLHAQAASGKTWDANGLVYKDGVYHFFYLVRPNAASPVQGHMVSTNLVDWEERPIAAWPSIEEGEEGVWSGSAVIDGEGRCHLFYTAVGPDRSSVFGHRQGHFVSVDPAFDRFERVDSSTIMMEDIPVPAQQVRDPFVFREEGQWYLTLTGSVLKEGYESLADQKIKWPDEAVQGAVLLFRSDDLYDWEYRGVAYESEDKPLWEVSDFIKKEDGLWFFSPGGMEYHVGSLDLTNAVFSPVRESGRVSVGEFYAYRSLTVPDGRHLVMGRLRDGGSDAKKWVGTYAFPRDWSFEGSVLIQQPAVELQSLRKEHFNYAGIVSNGVGQIDSAGTEYELVVEMDRGSAGTCGLEIRRSDDGAEGYRITWDGQKAYCQSIAPEPPEITAWWINPIPIVPENKTDPDRIKFHVFVDRGLVEVFVDDQKTFERPVEHIALACTNIAVFADGGDAEVVSYDRWNLVPCNN